MKFAIDLRRLLVTMSLGAAALLAAKPADASDKGLQFVGMSRTGSNDIRFVGDQLAAAGGNVQVALLPFEFNPGNPFGNATTLVQSTLPRLNGRLRLTVHAKWFPHDGQGNGRQAEFWSAWGTSRPNARQRRIRDRFLTRTRAFNLWVNQMRDWANQRGLRGNFRVTLVPVLEDTCPPSQQGAYRKLIAAVQSQQRGLGTSATRFRRSCLPQVAFRVPGATLEVHGAWSQVRGYLRSGDTWSNDGTDYNTNAFLRDQADARGRGVHVLAWRQAYNGQPRAARNWAQRTVNPFTGSGRRAERTFARLVLTQR